MTKTIDRNNYNSWKYRIQISKKPCIAMLVVMLLAGSLSMQASAATSNSNTTKARKDTVTKAKNPEELVAMINSLGDYFNIKIPSANEYYLKIIEGLEKEQKDSDSIDSGFSFDEMLDKIIMEKQRVDTGDNFLNEIISENNRLDYYDLYIKLAKKQGYIITSYEDYLRNYQHTDKKVMILRHDIDVASEATRKMLEIEKKNNVHASYYFRWATFDSELISEIAKAGFEVGLHYETIATYCIKYKKNTVTASDMEYCRKMLRQEIKDFKEKTGIDIKTVAAHGTTTNTRVGVLNNELFDGQDYSDYGIIGETYDKNILQNYVKSYICDGNLLRSNGFSYKANPIDSIMQEDKVIEFLSHPSHWDYSILDRAKMRITEMWYPGKLKIQ